MVSKERQTQASQSRHARERKMERHVRRTVVRRILLSSRSFVPSNIPVGSESDTEPYEPDTSSSSSCEESVNPRVERKGQSPSLRRTLNLQRGKRETHEENSRERQLSSLSSVLTDQIDQPEIPFQSNEFPKSFENSDFKNSDFASHVSPSGSKSFVNSDFALTASLSGSKSFVNSCDNLNTVR